MKGRWSGRYRRRLCACCEFGWGVGARVWFNVRASAEVFIEPFGLDSFGSFFRTRRGQRVLACPVSRPIAPSLSGVRTRLGAGRSSFGCDSCLRRYIARGVDQRWLGCCHSVDGVFRSLVGIVGYDGIVCTHVRGDANRFCGSFSRRPQPGFSTDADVLLAKACVKSRASFLLAGLV